MECGDVTWANETEIPAIQGRYLPDTKALGDGHDGDVHRVEVGALVLTDEVSRPPHIDGNSSTGSKVSTAGSRKPACASGPSFPQTCPRNGVFVLAVGTGHHRAGIQMRHGQTGRMNRSAKISSTRSERSSSPSPMPMNDT